MRDGYTLKTCVEAWGDIIPLYLVAETMAIHDASSRGNSAVHGPTFQAMRLVRNATLVTAAREGRLIVCAHDGQVQSAQKLCETSEIPLEWGRGDPNCRDIMALNSRVAHLIDWGKTNGDVFHFVDSPVLVGDLVGHDGKVIEAGYWRSYVGGEVLGSLAYKLPAAVKVGTSIQPSPLFSEIAGTHTETTDQRCERLLIWFREEEKRQAYGALARVAKRDGRKRQTVKADIDRARKMRNEAVGPISAMVRIIRN